MTLKWVRGSKDGSPMIGEYLQSRIHKSYTDACDQLYGSGYLDQDERIGLSSAVSAALEAFVSKAKEEYPDVFSRKIKEESVSDLIKE